MTIIYIYIVKKFYIKNLINPPIINTCPEGWITSYNNDNSLYDIICSNKNNDNIGSYDKTEFSLFNNVIHDENKPSFNLLNEHYNNSLSYTCDRYKFAKLHNISWNGITNDTELTKNCV
tara:strand:+ start:829 stop:1185 length:357 start_codon:yes stop_codon:yes gene_type:complete